MKLGLVTLPSGAITGVQPSQKRVIHEFDYSDECAVTDMGNGPTTISVTGTVATEAERIAVIGACEDARTVETYLYFPSVNGADDDRYYRVFTSPCAYVPVTGTVYTYSFEAIAIVPYIYDAATGARVT